MERDLGFGRLTRKAVAADAALSRTPTGASDLGRGATVDVALAELDPVYAFLYSRVGNHADAEDLIQQVALKALPRLRAGSSNPSVRAYLYATARSVLASFWGRRLRLPEAELRDEVWIEDRGKEVTAPAEVSERVGCLLSGLTPGQRQVLELRFLRGYSLRETATEMGRTVGGVKVLQLRALRAAATAQERPGAVPDPAISRP